MKKVLCLLLAALTVFGMISFANAAIRTPEIKVYRNGNKLMIDCVTRESTAGKIEDNVEIREGYVDSWQIGSKSNKKGSPVWIGKDVKSGVTTFRVVPQKDGEGSFYLGRYSYDASVSGTYKCLMVEYLKFDYVVQNGTISLTQITRSRRGADEIYTFTYTDRLEENDTVWGNHEAFEQEPINTALSRIVKESGLTKAQPVSGTKIHTETVRQPNDYDTLFVRKISENNKNDVAEVYFTFKSDQFKFSQDGQESDDVIIGIADGFVRTMPIIGSVTNSKGIIWAKAIQDSGRKYIPVHPCKEGDGVFYCAIYRTSPSLSMQNAAYGTPYAIYKINFSVVKDSSGKLRFNSISLDKVVIGKEVFSGSNSVGSKVITMTKNTSENTLTESEFSSLLNEAGLKGKIKMKIEYRVMG